MDILEMAQIANEEAAKVTQARKKTPVQELKDPVVTETRNGSRKKLFPFTQEEMKGFHLPGCDEKNLQAFSGTVSGVRQESNGIATLTVESLDGKVFPCKVLPNLYKKAMSLAKGDRVTGLVNGYRCVDLRLGPYFGTVSWKMFYKDNTKSVT